MGAVASLFQGLLFATMNTAILAFIGDKLENEFDIPIYLLPRILVFHFCMCFILGLVFVESLSVRYDSIHGPIIGPIGTFIATLLAIYATEIIVLFSSEYAILTPIVFAVAFTYGQAKAVNHNTTKFGPFIAAIMIMFALVTLLINSEYVDDFSNQIASYFDIDVNEDIPTTYLMGQGGLFYIPLFIPAFATISSYMLMWTQIPIN